MEELKTFAGLGLNAALVRAVAQEGYETPTPIQQQAVGHVLEGRDVCGIAQTGTGKTAAFALPILQRIAGEKQEKLPRGRKPRVLVLSPTRELANQITESFGVYGRHTPLRYTSVYGGVSQNPQAKALRDGVDVLVATPGRLMDLMNQRLIALDKVEILVVDEADRMFDMGFIRDIRKIVAALPRKRQTLLFSATMPPDIRQLADSILVDPVRVQIASRNPAAETVEQSVYFVEKKNKPVLLTHYIQKAAVTRAIVFTRTKHGADRVAKHLARAGIRAEAIHGDKSQNARQKALANFKSSKPPVLVATDVAARGLDIDEVSHVVNYDMPNVPETYIHRIGRTGRAGLGGIAASFCDRDEREHLQEIEKLLRKKTPVCNDHPPYPVQHAAPQSGGRGQKESRQDDSRGPRERKPHASGPSDDRHRSRRRKSSTRTANSTAAPAATAAPAKVSHNTAVKAPKQRKVAMAATPVGYTTMW